MAVDARLSLHRYRASPRRIFRRLASRLFSNRFLRSRQTGRTPTKIIRVATETKRAKLSIGDLIPNFRLSVVNRNGQVGPWDYKQRRNLVLIFFRRVECLKCKQLLREIHELHFGPIAKESVITREKQEFPSMLVPVTVCYTRNLQ